MSGGRPKWTGDPTFQGRGNFNPYDGKPWESLVRAIIHHDQVVHRYEVTRVNYCAWPVADTEEHERFVKLVTKLEADQRRGWIK